MICYYKKTFLKDLSEVSAKYRKKMEKLVFEDLPAYDEIPGMIDIKKIQGYNDYYRIRIGDYRIGCEIQKENTITFLQGQTQKRHIQDISIRYRLLRF